MASSPTPATPTAERVRDEMLQEAHDLVDEARAQGISLRLIGGLGVREHCRTAELCARDYTDLDMVASAGDAHRLTELFAGFGYARNRAVSDATSNAQLQFVRPCAHDRQPTADRAVAGRPTAEHPHDGQPSAGHPHADDHIDVFLDTFRMDHDVALARRLEVDRYTVPLSDLLLTKLQIFKLNEKDLRDIVTLLADLEVGERDDPDTIDGRYIARLCAADWGLFYDVTTNLQRVGERLAAFDLTDAQQDRARRGLARLIAAIDDSPKNLRWRLRARVGTRASWRNELEEQE